MFRVSKILCIFAAEKNKTIKINNLMKRKRLYDRPLMQVVKLREIPQLLQMSGREQYEAEDENPFGN